MRLLDVVEEFVHGVNSGMKKERELASKSRCLLG